MGPAILLCSAISSPTLGRLSDIFGRRNFFLVGNVSGIAGCVIAVVADATSKYMLIGAGALIGIAATHHQLAWAGLGEIVPRQYRALALGLFQASLFPAAAFGPVIGRLYPSDTFLRLLIGNHAGLAHLHLFCKFRKDI
jgi:MFS family permease